MVTYYDPHCKELHVTISYNEMVQLRNDLKISSHSTHLIATRLIEQIEALLPRLNNTGGVDQK